MASKPRQPPIALIQIRDNDVSVAVADIKKGLDQAGITHYSEELAYGVGKNLAKSFELIGLSTSVLTGGLVASLAAMTSSLSKFAQKQMTLRNVADSINLTTGELKQLINIGVAQGLSPEEARANVVAMARAVLDLRRGVDSDTRRKLEERGAFGSGTIVARQLQQRLREEGDRPYNIMRDILRQMAQGSTGSSHDRLATQTWREVFDLGGSAWNQAYDHIDEFGKETLEKSEQPLINFLLLKAEQERELMNFWAHLREAALPAMEKLNDVIGKWMDSESFPAFIARVKKWAEDLRDAPWDELRKSIDGTGQSKSKLIRLGSAIVRALAAIGRATSTVARWHGHTAWPGQAVPYQETQQLPFGQQPGYVSPPSNTDWRSSVNIQSMRQQQNPAATPGQTGATEPAEGGQGATTDLAGQLGLGGLEKLAEQRGIKLDEVEVTASREGDEAPGPFHFVSRPSLVHFQRDLGELKREIHDTVELIDVDKVKIRIGRTSGGDGGLSLTSRSPPMDTEAGGREGIQLKKKAPEDPFAYLKRRPLPTLPPYLEPQKPANYLEQAEKGGSPLAKLGLTSSSIVTFEQLREQLKSPSITDKTRKTMTEDMAETYGFAYPMTKTIYYNTDQASPLTTLVHEGGHVGRSLVQEAGRKDPTLRGYGVSLGDWKKGPKEELAQRYLDIEEAKSLRDQGIIGPVEAEIATTRAQRALEGQAGPFRGVASPTTDEADKLEYERHNKMYQEYAQRLLNKGQTVEFDLPKITYPADWKYDPKTGRRIPGRQERQAVDDALNGFDTGDSARLNLGVNVRAAPGTETETSITDGALMSNEGTTVTRELAR